MDAQPPRPLARADHPRKRLSQRSIGNTFGRVAGGRTCDLRCTLLLAVTAKEKRLHRTPHRSEEQAERALRAAESDDVVDEWGDLSKLHEVTSAETMRRLAQEEQAAGHEHW